MPLASSLEAQLSSQKWNCTAGGAIPSYIGGSRFNFEWHCSKASYGQY